MKDDTISRAAAIDALNGLTDIFLNNLPPTIYKADAVEAVKALPPAQPGWIPVTEQLPDVRQWVLCQCRAGIMDVLRLTADGSWSKNYPHTEYMSSFVVAWMPIPAPWEGDANG